MCSLFAPPRLASAAIVFFGHYGDVSHFAAEQGICRQTLYREAHTVARDLDPYFRQQQVSQFHQSLADLQAQVDQLQQQLASSVSVDRDKQAEFAATGQALGVSLSATRVLLAVLLRPKTPSVPKLGRFTLEAGRRAGALLAVLDKHSGSRARQIAADEIFTGRKPILMTLEQDSMCWLGGRLAANRDGDTWAEEFRRLPVAEQVTADGGRGIRKGLEQVNRERQQEGRSTAVGQRDHFHALQRARRGVRQAHHQATQALHTAEQAQQAYDKAAHDGVPRTSKQGYQLNQKWAQAERAFDQWSAQDEAFKRLRIGLRLFTPEGDLNTRAQAQEVVREALAGQSGAELSRARRLLGAEAFTFLDRVHEQLTALPVATELREAAVQVEGLRRRPEALRGEEPQARALRGVLLAAGLVLSLAGEAGRQATELVRGVLADAWRSSSLVEGLNSVVRMQQARQKRLTQGLLDLKRLYWNVHVFRAGKRKGTSPYGRLGLVLPAGGWWELLKRPPEQLGPELSQLNAAA
jgi:hypothetical protein